MVDFRTYEVVKLEDVAEYARAKQGKIYPAGTSTLQISATRGVLAFSLNQDMFTQRTLQLSHKLE
jgi:hypothetical protein